jgi:hypothetical protein
MKWMVLTLPCVLAACNATSSKPPRISASGFGSPRVDLARYQTFTFGPANPPEAGYQTTERSLEVQRRLTPLVETALEKRGYAPSSDKADLVIKISSGSEMPAREKGERDNSAPGTPRGFIGIDAYDRATGASIWHGTALAEIDPARIDEHLLAGGVERILADFPRRSSGQGPLGALDP